MKHFSRLQRKLIIITAFFLCFLVIFLRGGISIIRTPAATKEQIFTKVSANEAKTFILSNIPIIRHSLELITGIIFAQPYQPVYNSKPLKMDILKPVTNKLLPVVVYVPGGGFIACNKDAQIQLRKDIAEAGYVVASIEYRVAPLNTFPAPLEDVKSAIRFLRANAKKFGIDPDHIAIMGESAGGYLAALAGTTNGVKEFDKGDNLDQSSDVQAIIDMYGLSDLTKIADGFPKEIQALHDSPAATEALLVHGVPPFSSGGTIHDNPEKVAKSNPITYIDGNEPPFLIFHGDQDPLVSPNQTKILHEALLKKGVDSTRYVIKGAGHGGEIWEQPLISRIIISFLNKHLKK